MEHTMAEEKASKDETSKRLRNFRRKMKERQAVRSNWKSRSKAK
jgi:hypothetical protein